MTVKEIKKHLRIDLTIRNRNELFRYFRNIYINQEREKRRSLESIARDLNLLHASVLNSLKKTEIYERDPLFMLIKKAYNERDKSYIEEYKKSLNIRKLEYSKISAERHYQKTKILIEEDKGDFIFQKVEKFERPSILEVAKNLRYVDTILNNKPYPEWTKKDFENYFKIIEQ